MIQINICFLNKGLEGVLVTLIKDSKAYENVNILYLDMNDLYGRAMSQYLPISNFK